MRNHFPSRYIWLVLLSLSFVARLFAQPMPDKATLRGKVTDEGGKPLGGAAITLRRGSDAGSAAFWGGVTYTDARGEFLFEGAEEGSYYLSVEAGGYAPVQNKAQAVKQNSPQVTFSLKLLGTLPFRVLAPDGKPLVSVPVPTALTSTETGAYYQYFSQVDNKGVATINGIVPGVYDLSTVLPAHGYGGASKIEVKSGANASIDVPLQPGGTLRVVARHDTADSSVRKSVGGVVISFAPHGLSSGPGARPLDWMFLSTEQGRSSRFTRDGDGTSEFQNVPPGLYDVTLTPGNFADAQKLFAEVKAGAVAEVELNLKPLLAGQLTVLVRRADGTPAADSDFIVLAQQMGTPAPASILPAGAVAPTPTEQVVYQVERRAHSDSEGRFTIYPLQPARWRLIVQTSRNTGSRESVTTANFDIVAGGEESTEVKFPEKNEN